MDNKLYQEYEAIRKELLLHVGAIADLYDKIDGLRPKKRDAKLLDLCKQINEYVKLTNSEDKLDFYNLADSKRYPSSENLRDLFHCATDDSMIVFVQNTGKYVLLENI